MKKLDMSQYFIHQGYGKEQLEYIISPPKENSKWLLNDIENALNIIDKAQYIAVIGDYDFDGISATTIAVKALRKIGKKTEFFIPNRFKDGYGLNVNLVQRAFKAGCDTILTVDNGIAAYDAISYAKELDFNVIVTDHHKINRVPPADAIIHPAMGNYPFESISGCQVAYKLADALFETHNIHDDELMKYFLQLSSMSIVSDVMPLASKDMNVNENRLWLKKGVDSINADPCQQIAVLMNRYQFKKADETVIGFYLVPCINAIGRLSDATYAVNYFLNDKIVSLEKMADKIIMTNEKRKELVEKQMKFYKPVYSSEKKAVFVIGDDIHEGIAGLIAGKHSSGKGTVSFCFTRCEKPNGDVFYKGSGRNDTDISLIDMLNSIPEGIMLGYGGHKDACGLSVRLDKIDSFVEYVSSYADRKANSNQPYIIHIRQDQIDNALSFVRQFKPFGNGFVRPVIEADLLISNIMTTKSGFIRFTSISGESNYNLWMKDADISLYHYLDEIPLFREHASGAITYYTELKAKATIELDYGPRKGQEIYEPSLNCMNIILLQSP